jgi:hypothetical protein
MVSAAGATRSVAVTPSGGTRMVASLLISLDFDP